MSWRPIDTYRHGTDPADVLVAFDAVVGEARYHEEEGEWWWAGNDPTDSWGDAIYPTHWQPMPDPPDSAQIGES